MDMDFKGNKSYRLLFICELLNRKRVIKTSELAEKLGVSIRTIERDMVSLIVFLENYSYDTEQILTYDKNRKEYQLMKFDNWLHKDNILKLCKQAIKDGDLKKEEIELLINRLATPEERKTIKQEVTKF